MERSRNKNYNNTKKCRRSNNKSSDELENMLLLYIPCVSLNIFIYEPRHYKLNQAKIGEVEWQCFKCWILENRDVFSRIKSRSLAEFVKLHTHELCDNVRKIFFELLSKSSMQRLRWGLFAKWFYAKPLFIQFLLYFLFNISHSPWNRSIVYPNL